MTGARTWIQAGLCALAVALTGPLYAGFFGGFLDASWPITAAAGAGALAAALTARWPLALRLPCGVLGFGVYATAVLLPGTTRYGLPTGRTAAALWTGVSRGWARMLSVALPADPRPDLLMTPVLVAFAAAFTAVLLLRSSRPLVPAAPPMVAFAVAVLASAGRDVTQFPATGAVLAAVALLLLARAAADSTPGRLAGALLAGVPLALAVAAAGVAGAAALPLGRHRLDPHAWHPPPLRFAATLTPLATVGTQRAESPPRTLFTVDLGGQPAPDRIRLAALDSYDGLLWTSGDRFLLAGHRLAPDPGLSGARRVSARIAVADLPGPFVPAIGWPVGLAGPTVDSGRFGFSDRSGALVTDGSLRGTGYDVTGEVRPPDDGLRTATASPAREFDGYRGLPPGLPDPLRTLAADLAGQSGYAYGRLLAIERYVRAVPSAPDTPTGQSYAALARMLTGRPEDRVADAQQPAAAFAVLARAAGLPARVAVGYLLRDGRQGSYTVTTRDAHAWAEVHFDGYGWVAFDPAGTATVASARGPDTPDVAEPTPTPAAVPTAAAAPSPVPTAGIAAVGRAARILHSGRNTSRAAVAAGAGLAALAVLAGTGVVVAKRRRRTRRRAGPPARSVVGAWREALDRLVESGVRIPASTTPHRAAAQARERLGDRHAGVETTLAELSELVDAAVFAPAGSDAAAASRAWRLEAVLRRQLRPGRVGLGRLRARLDPRPLLPAGRQPRELVDA
jgi:transglutaminase-like putative cysteine protease